MKGKEAIYIAGPECFFENGYQVLAAMRKESEAKGHTVTLPNDDPLKLDHEDLRKNADEIFANLEVKMNESTMIIADLDPFRSAEPDSGTIYELGMAYARGLLIYGHTRDQRSLVWKDQKLSTDEGRIFDERHQPHYYAELPFSPMVTAATKIIEGNYSDVLTAYESDRLFGFGEELVDYEKKAIEVEEKSIFVASQNYYDPAVQATIKGNLVELTEAGYCLVQPYFRERRPEEEVAAWLKSLITENAERIAKCQYFVADLNDYRGYECSNDIAFFCGFAFQMGKKLYGFMEDIRPMKEKIPYVVKNGKFKDMADRDVENFDYPLNLMFASSMKITAGTESAWQQDFLKQSKLVGATGPC